MQTFLCTLEMLPILDADKSGLQFNNKKGLEFQEIIVVQLMELLSTGASD